MLSNSATRFKVHRLVIGLAMLALSSLIWTSVAGQPSLSETPPSTCSNTTPVASQDGIIRLAFVVGIDEYQSVRGLSGAVNDARRIVQTIEGSGAGKFPRENICLIVNDEATYSGFKQAFQSAFIDRITDLGETDKLEVLFYYAGHGSRLVDDNGDEPDGVDETLVLHDSFSATPSEPDWQVPQLRDDEFNAMLTELYELAPNLTVILDSCHSGSGTRDVGFDAKQRFVRTDQLDRSSPIEAPGNLTQDGAHGFAEFTPQTFPNAVFLSAASDHQTAVEVDGAGVFTDAILTVLRQRGGAEITYDQLYAQIQARLGISYAQKPLLSGASSRFVFSKGSAYSPTYDWKVLEANEESLTIQGLPTPGTGVGAEFVILPGSLSAEDEADPTQIKARAKAVEALSGNVWSLEYTDRYDRGEITVGDYAKLVVPSSSAIELTVRVRPESEDFGVAETDAFTAALINALDTALTSADRPLVKLGDEGFDLEVSQSPAGAIELRGSDGAVRNLIPEGGEVGMATRSLAFDLANHLQQKTLLNGWTIFGGKMVPNQTLEVRLKPFPLRPGQGVCKEDYRPNPWTQSDPNTLQEVPLCTAYEIIAKLADDAPTPVKVAGSVLSATGQMNQLPAGEQRSIVLWKNLDGTGQETSLGVFQAGPDSLNVEEYVYVLAVPTDLNIPWHLLSTTKRQAPLGVDALAQREYGTYSVVPVKTVANMGFGADENSSKRALTREYTIDAFDITPYLPDAKDSSALYRILSVADELANVRSTPVGTDGAPYKQHAWCEGDTDANLSTGIDCSRSIWYAFTRAGLPYNRYATSIPDEGACVSPYDPTRDGYLYTGDMARNDYLMSDNFQDCLAPDEDGNVEFQIGDVLVYRDPNRGDGHTVMVIDPEERIAWGSHGWDGNPRFVDPETGTAPDADLGVEYQKIKIKADWQRWDRSTMELSACWRHDAFVSEKAMVRSFLPGLAAICERVLKPDTGYFRSSICQQIIESSRSE